MSPLPPSRSDDQPASPETPEERVSDASKELRPLSRWAWILVPSFLVAYPLSIGPVAKLARSGAMSMSLAMWLERYFYGPLVFVSELIPGLAWLLRGYVELWVSW